MRYTIAALLLTAPAYAGGYVAPITDAPPVTSTSISRSRPPPARSRSAARWRSMLVMRPESTQTDRPATA